MDATVIHGSDVFYSKYSENRHTDEEIFQRICLMDIKENIFNNIEKKITRKERHV